MSNGEMPRVHGQSITQKILSAHNLSNRPVVPGETIRVRIDWVIASELALGGMNHSFNKLGNPSLFAPDRFYLAIDHTVDPITAVSDPTTQGLVRLSRDFACKHNLSAFYDVNQTIMHTKFYRNHCVPGSIVVGADSHTTSHGAISAFSIGLGGADVAMAAVTGETWITVPEEVCVTFTGRVPFGISGKDIVLKVLSVLGCNGLALDKTIEYRTELDTDLSMDARFTICNMSAEMGAFSAIFPATGTVQSFYTANAFPSGVLAQYYTSDIDVTYCNSIKINLDELTPKLAMPFSPDNVVSVSEYEGQAIDGCFIGACTTTEEELIVAGLVLEQILDSGVLPSVCEKRLVIPGDLDIHNRLAASGLLQVYERAGFRIGVPGCHMCLGLGSERARAGERWLSSQNRNFRNRMGVGSIAWLASGATVAASAMTMQITDPRAALNCIDRDRLRRLLAARDDRPNKSWNHLATPPRLSVEIPNKETTSSTRVQLADILGSCLTFGDNVDTDAIIPGEFCTSSDPAFLGKHCFHHIYPEFPSRVSAGNTVLVAGVGWGCGSSREHAAWALCGAGVRAVLAKSFGSIHRRNLINVGIPALVVENHELFDLVRPGDELLVDMNNNLVEHVVSGRSFAISSLPDVMHEILAAGGLIPSIGP